MNRKKGRSLFSKKTRTRTFAITPAALSIYWDWGIGEENVTKGRATIVTIDGPLERASFWFDGYDAILERFKQAAADDSTTIVLKLSSPGGECAGLYACVRMMRAVKESCGKRVIAYADEHAYSAAYALACVADEIYLPHSGGVGSVGVLCECVDVVGANEKWGINAVVVHSGARKVDCHPDVPLSDEAIAGVQADVDRLADMFRELVAEARGVDVDAIAALEADCFMGDTAIEAGLADGVMGLDELLTMIDEAANEASNEQPDAAASTENEEAMGMKAAKIKASEVKAVDELARPRVATPSAVQIKSGMATTGLAASASAEEEEKDDEEEEGEEEGSSSTTTTTTTTTAEEDCEEEGDEEEAEGEEDEEEAEGEDDDKEAGAKRPAPIAAKSSTSVDVLRAVKEITGSSSPAEQIGALHAIRDKAATAEKQGNLARLATAKRKKVELKSTVDKAIRAGKLPPAQRDWAMSAGVDVVKGYLANASVVAPRTPLRQKETKGPNGQSTRAAGEGVIPEAIANVSRAMGMDPKAVAKHADELRAQGLIH